MSWPSCYPTKESLSLDLCIVRSLRYSPSNGPSWRPQNSMATSTTWYQCWATRSDGCRETFTGRDGARELNEPSAAQMDDTPKPPKNTKEAAPKFLIMDYYKRLDPKDAKAVEWRRKLGGMMMTIMVPEDNKALKRMFEFENGVLNTNALQAENGFSRSSQKDTSSGSI